MTTFAEIETAARKLPPLERERLIRSLLADAPSKRVRGVHARPRRLGADYLLAAPDGAPLMTPELVKELLEDSP
jgi:hypothetical protein